MFKNPGPAPLDFSNQGAQNASAQAVNVLSNKFGGSSNLSAPLYQSGSQSSSSNVAGMPSGGGQTLTTQTTTLSVDYSSLLEYGGGDVVVEPAPVTSTKHFNQGIGNGMEGGDPGKSQPHGGSNDEGGRTPGQRWIPKLFGF